MPRDRLIIIRQGTTQQWLDADAAYDAGQLNDPKTDLDRILASGEFGKDIDLNVIKSGDGHSKWSELTPINAPAVTIADVQALSIGLGGM